MTIVYFKIVISIVLSIVGWNVFRFKATVEPYLEKRNFTTNFLIFSVLFRISPYILVYLILGYQAQSDVNIFWKSAQEAAKIQLVYRDFDSLYSPFFVYITAIPLFIWDDARAVTFLMIIVESLAVYVTAKVFPQKASFKALIYYLLAGPFMFCVLGGQEDIWMWLFAALCIGASQRKNTLLIGIVAGLGLLTTKAFFVLLFPVLFFALKDKVKFILGAALVGLPVLIVLFYFGGTSFLMPIRLAQDPMSPNFWSIFYPILGELEKNMGVKVLNWIGLGILLVSSSFLVFKLKLNENLQSWLPQFWVLMFCILMLFQIGSYANYLFIFALPFVWKVVDFDSKKELILLLIANILMAIHTSLWFRIGKPFYQFSDLTKGIFIADYTIQIMIIGFVIYFLNLSYLSIKKSSKQTQNP